MPRYVALLRGINVGGKNLVPMAELRALGAELGYENVHTLLQSGNVLFESAEASNEKLESKWAGAVSDQFGLKIDMVVRSAEEWKEAIEANPFPLEEGLNLSHFFAYFLQSKPEPEAIVAVLAFDRGPEKPCIFGKTLYCYYPDTVIDSKFTGAWIEKTLGVRATARNWNTVLKIAALLKG